MWLFSETGFVSAVMDPKDKNKIVVRAREKKSLEPLMAMTGVKIVYPDRYTDYPHRVVVTRQQYADWVLSLIEQMQYTNYKTQVTKTRGSDFAHPLHQVWSTMLQLEEDYQAPTVRGNWSYEETQELWNEYPSMKGKLI
jgi:hypothetical protein